MEHVHVTGSIDFLFALSMKLIFIYTLVLESMGDYNAVNQEYICMQLCDWMTFKCK